MPRASCTTPATTCMASCPPTEARHDPALAAVSGAVGPAGADLAGAQPEPVAGHGPARRRARPAAGSGIRTAAAAQGAHPQLPAGRAATAAGGVRHRPLELHRRPAHPARRRPGALRLRRHPADPHQPPRPGGAGLHHHLDAGTIWVSYDPIGNMLLIHVLDLVDEQTWIDTIQQRYERPLLEIFQSATNCSPWRSCWRRSCCCSPWASRSYGWCADRAPRSEEHTSELQSLMRISSAVFCL